MSDTFVLLRNKSGGGVRVAYLIDEWRGYTAVRVWQRAKRAWSDTEVVAPGSVVGRAGMAHLRARGVKAGPEGTAP